MEEPALAPSLSAQQDPQHKKSLCFAPGSYKEVRYQCTGVKSDHPIPEQCHSLHCVINTPIKKHLNTSLNAQKRKQKHLEYQCDAGYLPFGLSPNLQILIFCA